MATNYEVHRMDIIKRACMDIAKRANVVCRYKETGTFATCEECVKMLNEWADKEYTGDCVKDTHAICHHAGNCAECAINSSLILLEAAEKEWEEQNDE